MWESLYCQHAKSICLAKDLLPAPYFCMENALLYSCQNLDVECLVALGSEKEIHTGEFASYQSVPACFTTDFHNDNFITPSDSVVCNQMS
jgi:hypothetical protein